MDTCRCFLVSEKRVERNEQWIEEITLIRFPRPVISASESYTLHADADVNKKPFFTGIV